jgi:hypothetical protein
MQASQHHSTDLREDVNQLGFPSVVTIQEIAREKTLGGAIGLCAKAAGLEPKQVQDELGTDKAQFSRWESGSEGIIWPKFTGLMDFCGNDAPLLWMNLSRGYDLSSLRRLESETERELRLARERIAMLEHDKRVLTEALRAG